MPSSSFYFLWDREILGFGVRVNPTGKKVYVIRYTPRGQGQRIKNLGAFPAVRVDHARQAAAKVLTAVAFGEDPFTATPVAAPEADHTVGELIDRYLTDHVEAKRAKNTLGAFQSFNRTHIKPALGDKAVRAVTFADIDALHKALADKPTTANSVLAILSAAFNRAERLGWRDQQTNPCHGVERYTLVKRERDVTPDIDALVAKLRDKDALFSVARKWRGLLGEAADALVAQEAVVEAARWAAVQPDATFAMITLRNVLEEEGFAALDAPPDTLGTHQSGPS